MLHDVAFAFCTRVHQCILLHLPDVCGRSECNQFARADLAISFHLPSTGELRSKTPCKSTLILTVAFSRFGGEGVTTGNAVTWGLKRVDGSEILSPWETAALAFGISSSTGTMDFLFPCKTKVFGVSGGAMGSNSSSCCLLSSGALENSVFGGGSATSERTLLLDDDACSFATGGGPTGSGTVTLVALLALELVHAASGSPSDSGKMLGLAFDTDCSNATRATTTSNLLREVSLVGSDLGWCCPFTVASVSSLLLVAVVLPPRSFLGICQPPATKWQGSAQPRLSSCKEAKEATTLAATRKWQGKGREPNARREGETKKSARLITTILAVSAWAKPHWVGNMVALSEKGWKPMRFPVSSNYADVT